MRKLMMAVAAAAMLLPGAALADQRNFVLTNGTSRTISELYISPTNVNEWEEDVLGVDTLEEMDKTTIRFVDDLDECVYDLKIVHDDGDTAIWTGINLCENSFVVVQYQDDGTPIAQYGNE
ncbi:MAG: argininosuccinate lyase [Sphingomonadales bacterium]|nr:MAG: argininosuccinate lyase [Sphingomonadales bacterium]